MNCRVAMIMIRSYSPRDMETISSTTLKMGDQIDLSAFDLDDEDLIPLISIRGNVPDGTARVVIDLRSVGGGSIEISDLTDLDDDALDIAPNDPDTPESR